MTVRAIRGATQLDSDDQEHLLDRTRELIEAVVARNGLVVDDFISIFFTATSDLHSGFPAVAARQIGFAEVPLMCARELEIDGSLPRAIRLMAHVESDTPKSAIQHVYLHGAAALRPDLATRGDD